MRRTPRRRMRGRRRGGSSDPQQPPWRRAARPAVLYLGVSGLWIVGSDRLLAVLVSDPKTLTRYQSLKGLAFVVGTTTLLFVVLWRDHRRRQGNERRLRDGLARERELTRRLRRLDELKNAFLVGVSHELRTPLTSVLGCADTLHDHGDRLTPDRRAELLDAIRRNAARLGRDLTQLLDTRRLTEGFGAPTYEPVDLTELAREVVERMASADHPITVMGGPVVPQADAARLLRLLENLVDNVNRHTPAGTRARITLEARGKDVEIRVEDDGPGIPDELREGVFEAFERGGQDEHAPGLGLGLFLVRRYADQHNGFAWAEGSPEGGACIRIVLPTDPARPPAAQPEDERGSLDAAVERLARRAGVRQTADLTVHAADQRRREVIGVLVAAVVVLPAAMAASAFEPSLVWLPDALVPIVQGALVALGLALAAYGLEKERDVRRLEGALAEEQEVRQSLEARLREALEPVEHADAVKEEPAGRVVARRVTAEARRLVEAEHASLLAARGEEFVVVAEAGRGRGLLGKVRSLESGIAGYVARTGQPLLLRDDVDVLEVAANLGTPLPHDGPPPRSAICMPIRRGEDAVAVLNVNVLDGPRRFDGEDLRLLTLFAQEAGGLLSTEELADAEAAGP